jgi:nicotinamidase-related amidase
MARVSRLESALLPESTGVILFDTMNGYLHSTNEAKQKHLAEKGVIENMQRVLNAARKAGITTLYPAGRHAADASDTVSRLTDTDMELRPLGPEGRPIKPSFYAGSWETEIADEVAPIEDDVIVPKHRWNAFYQTDLELHLRVRGIDTIVLAGGSTDVGIASTAFAARDMDLGLVIVSDCCYSMRGNNNHFFMERVFPRMGRVMDSHDVARLMAEGQKQAAS